MNIFKSIKNLFTGKVELDPSLVAKRKAFLESLNARQTVVHYRYKKMTQAEIIMELEQRIYNLERDLSDLRKGIRL